MGASDDDFVFHRRGVSGLVFFVVLVLLLGLGGIGYEAGRQIGRIREVVEEKHQLTAELRMEAENAAKDSASLQAAAEKTASDTARPGASDPALTGKISAASVLSQVEAADHAAQVAALIDRIATEANDDGWRAQKAADDAKDAATTLRAVYQNAMTQPLMKELGVSVEDAGHLADEAATLAQQAMASAKAVRAKANEAQIAATATEAAAEQAKATLLASSPLATASR